MSEEEAIEILKKCFEDIRGSMFWRDEWQALDVVEEYIRNSINKDKIREKIEELEKEKTEVIHELDFKSFYTLSQLKDIEISVLNELLEE